MRRLLIPLAVFVLCLAPRAAVAQQGALRGITATASSFSVVPTLTSAPRTRRPPDLFPSPLPLASPRLTSRRQALRLPLTERVYLRASSDWMPSGLIGTLGFGLRF